VVIGLYSIFIKCLIVPILSRYKYRSKYVLCGRSQAERTGVDALDLLTLWLRFKETSAKGKTGKRPSVL